MLSPTYDHQSSIKEVKEKCHKFIYWFTPLAIIEAYTVVRLLHDVPTNFKFWQRSWTVNLLEFICFVASAYLLIAIVHMIRSKIKIDVSKTSKIGLKLLIQLLVILAAGTILVGSLGTVLDHVFYGSIKLFDILVIYIISLSYATMYWLLLTGVEIFSSYTEGEINSEKLSKEKTDAELKYLKSQINPHTLFNVINNIYFLMDQDVKKAKKTLSTFSDMLSYQLYDCDTNLIHINKEIEYINNYIEIERLRREHIKIDFSIGSLIYHTSIPPFILLPFIENAFKHIGGENWVNFSISTTENQFLFTAENAIERIKENHETGGIGLENVNKRLGLLFPAKHKIEIIKSENSYKVVLELMYDEN